MGLIDKALGGGSGMDIFSPAQATYSRGGGFGLDSSTGQAISIFGDPMDLFGERAAYAQEQAEAAYRTGAEEAIAQQREQYQRMQELYAPYRQLGEGALGQLAYMTMGEGEGQPFQLSQMGEHQRGLGEMALGGAFTAGGRSRSSAAEKGFGEFYADLLSEDVERQLGEQYDLVKVAQGAAGAVGQAGQVAQQNIGGIYGQLGTMLGQSMVDYGKMRQASMQGLSNIGSGLMAYGAQ